MINLISDVEFPGSVTLLFMNDSNNSGSDRALECFSVIIIDDDIVEPLEMISLTFGILDPQAPQVQPTSNAVLAIEDDDGKWHQLYDMMYLVETS